MLFCFETVTSLLLLSRDSDLISSLDLFYAVIMFRSAISLIPALWRLFAACITDNVTLCSVAVFANYCQLLNVTVEFVYYC